ncbi:MAG: multicopper oxidase domain-containing protein [Bryobacteraceae bacterium]
MDFTADQPGPALFHCHIQQHMDYGPCGRAWHLIAHATGPPFCSAR